MMHVEDVAPYVPVPPPGEDELPYSDGEPRESELHVKQSDLLRESLEYGWADRQDFYVASNMFVYFSELQTKKNDFRGPDVVASTPAMLSRSAIGSIRIQPWTGEKKSFR